MALAMGNSMTDMDEAKVKRRARRKHNNLQRYMTYLEGELSAMSRWLMASLLAINGAGSAATLKAFETGVTPVGALISFLAGIFGALMNGWSIQYYSNKLRPHVRDLCNYFDEVAETGIDNEAQELEITRALEKVEKSAVIAPIWGWLSAMLFILGMALLADGIYKV